MELIKVELTILSRHALKGQSHFLRSLVSFQKGCLVHRDLELQPVHPPCTVACSRKREVVAAHGMQVHLGVKKGDLDGIKKNHCHAVYSS